MSKRLIVSLCLLALIVPLGLSAQAVNAASNTNTVTYSLYGEDKDFYLNVLNFDKLVKNVLFLGFGSPSDTDLALQAGVGVKAMDGLYLGGNVRITNAGKNATDDLVIDEDITVTNNVISARTKTTNETLSNAPRFQMSGSLIAGISKILGVKYDLVVDSNQLTGNLNPTLSDASISGANAYTQAGFTSGTTATNNNETLITDAAGNVISRDVTKYGKGLYDQSNSSHTLTAGLDLDFLTAQLYFQVGVTSGARKSAKIAYTEVPGLGFTALTPAVSLEATPTAINDVKSYTYTEVSVGGNSANVTLTPGLNLGTTIAVDAKNKVGVNLDWKLAAVAFSDTYNDLAGTATPVAGTANFGRVWDYQAVFNGTTNALQTTITDTRAFRSIARTDVTNTFQLPVSYTAQPIDGFTFAVKYIPELAFRSRTDETSYGFTKVTTVDDGTGASGAGSSVTTVTLDPATRSVDTYNAKYTHTFDLGAQFFLIPSSLRLNLGGQVSQVVADNTETDTQWTGHNTIKTTTQTSGGAVNTTNAQYDADVAAANDGEANGVDNLNTVNGGFKAGLTYFVNENMYLDLLYNVTDITGDIFSLKNWSLGMTIRL